MELENVDRHVETIDRYAELKECHCEEMSPVGFLSLQRGQKSIVRTLILRKYGRIAEVDHPNFLSVCHLRLMRLRGLAPPTGLLDGSRAAYNT